MGGPPPSLSRAGGVCTSAGRGLPGADVGSRSRGSSRLLPAAPSRSRALASRPRGPLSPTPARRPSAAQTPVVGRCRRRRSGSPTLAPPGPAAVSGVGTASRASRRPGSGKRASPRGSWDRWRREDGRQAEDPYGQREAQQEHHSARQRRQDLEKCPRRESVGRTLVIGPLHFCCLWLCNFPDYSKYQDGHVK